MPLKLPELVSSSNSHEDKRKIAVWGLNSGRQDTVLFSTILDFTKPSRDFLNFSKRISLHLSESGFSHHNLIKLFGPN